MAEPISDECAVQDGECYSQDLNDEISTKASNEWKILIK